jgi:hypothetical protein
MHFARAKQKEKIMQVKRMAIKPLSTAIGVTNKIGFAVVTTSTGDGYGVIVDVFGGTPAIAGRAASPEVLARAAVPEVLARAAVPEVLARAAVPAGGTYLGVVYPAGLPAVAYQAPVAAVAYQAAQPAVAYQAAITAIAAVPATVVTATIAATNGKIKIYKNIDDAFKDLVKFKILNQAGGVVSYVYEGIDKMEAKPFSGDIVAKTKATIVSYNTEMNAQITARNALDAKLALLPKATTAELALWTEVKAQREAINEQVTWLSVEVQRLNALLPRV